MNYVKYHTRYIKHLTYYTPQTLWHELPINACICIVVYARNCTICLIQHTLTKYYFKIINLNDWQFPITMYHTWQLFHNLCSIFNSETHVCTLFLVRKHHLFNYWLLKGKLISNRCSLSVQCCMLWTVRINVTTSNSWFQPKLCKVKWSFNT